MSDDKLYSRLKQKEKTSGTIPICPNCNEVLCRVVIYYEDGGIIDGRQAWNVMEDIEVTPYVFQRCDIEAHLNHYYKCDRCGYKIYRGQPTFDVLDMIISVIVNRYEGR